MPIRLRLAFLFSLVFFLAGILSVQAQVQVDLSIKRSLYIVYEPVIATVSITNLSGRDLELADTPLHRWFGFQVETADGRPIPPSDGDYANEPLTLGSGQKITRSVNLTPLYPINEFGPYRVRATIFVPEFNRFFSSPSLNIEISDGRPLWEKTVGVPEGLPGAGTTRTITLISQRLTQTTQLYIRIQDKPNGVVYCTHQLGRLLSFGPPSVLLDEKNQIHILQNVAPKSFLYSKVGLNGEILDRKAYNEFSSRPLLRRVEDGSVTIIGGQSFDPTAPKPEETLPSLADRPIPIPGSTPPPPKDEKRPENLLSR